MIIDLYFAVACLTAGYLYGFGDARNEFHVGNTAAWAALIAIVSAIWPIFFAVYYWKSQNSV